MRCLHCLIEPGLGYKSGIAAGVSRDIRLVFGMICTLHTLSHVQHDYHLVVPFGGTHLMSNNWIKDRIKLAFILFNKYK